MLFLGFVGLSPPIATVLLLANHHDIWLISHPHLDLEVPQDPS